MSKTATCTTPVVGVGVGESLGSSVRFMKQLTSIAVGTILHTKRLVPADCFVAERFCGVDVLSLSKTCGDRVAQFISEALIQAFHAFDHKYLEQLVLCFYEGECRADAVLEYYVFQYSYRADGARLTLGARGAPPARLATRRAQEMIQTCVLLVTQLGRQLPAHYDVALRLYYNQDAPEGYQAPGYEDGGNEEDHLAATLEEAVHVGTVGTPFHELSTHLYIKEDSVYSREALPTQNPPTLSQMERDSFDGCSGKETVSEMECCVSESSAARIQCVCLLDVLDEDEMILICQYCGRREHATCHGVWRAPGGQGGQGGAHCCLACWGQAPAGRAPTDTALAALAPHERPARCAERRALARLQRHGVAPAHCEEPRPITDEQLKRVLPRFFHDYKRAPAPAPQPALRDYRQAVAALGMERSPPPHPPPQPPRSGKRKLEGRAPPPAARRRLARR